MLESREKDLNEREENLKRRVELFEEKYPQMGRDSDVLHLNVGGSTNFAVLRRTLTHFENSMLATRFSGRWDDSLEKDKDGNFFVDQDPEVFVLLLNFLRQCDQNKRHNIKIQPPHPTFAFCSMLEYYDLMCSVYPQEWRTVWFGMDADPAIITKQRSDNNSVTIYTGEVFGGFKLELQKGCPTKPIDATSFTVAFDRGSVGQVGWMDNYVCRGGVGHWRKAFALDIDEQAFFLDGCPMAVTGKQFLEVSSAENPVIVHCAYDLLTKTYSIRIHGTEPEIVATHRETKAMIPCISFKGQVTISNLTYAY